MSISIVRVRAYPRIHIGLLDMGGATRRAYGGCGFAVDACPVEVNVTCGASLGIDVGCDVEDRSIVALSGAVQRLRSRFPQVTGHLQVTRCILEHVGLGSKTALLLSALKGLQIANGLSLSNHELIELSGRGGASGVGIHAFFNGGFLIDSGHRQDGVFPLQPSSVHDVRGGALLTMRLTVPSGWNVHLMLPSHYETVAGAYEREFFAKNTPLPRAEVLESIAAVYHAIVPGVVSSNLSLLALGLKDLHATGFKGRELAFQKGSAILVREIYHQTHLPVGMSSMGPIVYVLSDGDESTEQCVKDLVLNAKGNYLGKFSPINHGCIAETYE